MRIRSIRIALYILISSIFLQLTTVCVDLYFQKKHAKIKSHSEDFATLENNFLNSLILEKDTEINILFQKELITKYNEIIASNNQFHLNLQNQLIEDRIKFHQRIFTLWEKRSVLHTKLNTILPELAQSVNYIHKHHLTHIKNVLQNSHVQNTIPSKKIAPDEEQPETEATIISSAIDIQHATLALMEIFSRLQRGLSPKTINTDFNAAITRFYQATNSFEESSLDAQDGLLVEELLVEGEIFEKSFIELLRLKTELDALHQTSLSNRKEILNDLLLNKRRNDETYHHFSRAIEINNSISFAINMLVFITLLYIAQKMIQALSKVTQETRKIKENHAYKIPNDPKDFTEFKNIFNALNLMGEAVSKNINKLHKAQNILEDQVEMRTRELSLANTQLTREIEERIKNEKQRRELEEQLSRAEKMEAIGTLAGGVAHDLNNILSGIVSYPELLLLDLPDDHKFTAPLKTIKNSGERAAIIVEDLLTMARRGVARQAPIDLNTLVGEFIESHEVSNIRKFHPEVTLLWQLGAKQAQMHGSKAHLVKMLMNLTMNAAESIQGKGSVTITTSNQYIDTVLKGYDEVNEGDYITLQIKDNGIGISPENIERIFEPFFTTKSLGRSGSGLGMAVVWGVVKDHGGYIDIQSSKGEGTSFNLFFPLQRAEDECSAENTELSKFMANGESVLVVDDIKEQREIASLMLQRLGYAVDTVSGGEEAIQFLRQKSVDIILLDMIMTPGIDGLETYRQLIEIAPHLKVIIVSGFSESEKVREAQQLGAGPYVKKPYSMDEIAKVLRQELKNS